MNCPTTNRRSFLQEEARLEDLASRRKKTCCYKHGTGNELPYYKPEIVPTGRGEIRRPRQQEKENLLL